MQERSYAQFFITEKAGKMLRQGHSWVYADEITQIKGNYDNGELVDVLSPKGRWMGTGFVNDHSKIRVRLISQNTNDRFDEAFFERRLRHAIEYRQTVMGQDFSCCRLIFGEADFFPGLTIDRLEDILVSEVCCLGVERIKDGLYRLLVKILMEKGITVRAIYERNDSPLRIKEGMEKDCGFYPLPSLETKLDGKIMIRENGIEYEVDYMNGQKTGFFLDQKYNRLAVARLAKDRTILDCCTHTGAFALNAAQAGAKHVTAVDISQDALQIAQANAHRNHLDEKMTFVCADVFDLLTDLAQKKAKPYDFIILDPPAFTKSHATVKNAYRGYKEINRKAMKLLPRGGYLATCSCSHFMTNELFAAMLQEAALEASVKLRQIEFRQQAADHPILWGVPETNYLKFYLFQVV